MLTWITALALAACPPTTEQDVLRDLVALESRLREMTEAARLSDGAPVTLPSSQDLKTSLTCFGELPHPIHRARILRALGATSVSGRDEAWSAAKHLEPDYVYPPDALPPAFLDAWAHHVEGPWAPGSWASRLTRRHGRTTPWRWYQWPYRTVVVDGRVKKLRLSRSRLEGPTFVAGVFGSLTAIGLHSLAAAQRSRGRVATGWQTAAWTVTGASAASFGVSLTLAAAPKNQPIPR